MLADVWKELFAEEEGREGPGPAFVWGKKDVHKFYFSTLSPSGELISHQCLFDIHCAQNIFKVMFGFYIKP